MILAYAAKALLLAVVFNTSQKRNVYHQCYLLMFLLRSDHYVVTKYDTKTSQ